MNATLKAVAAIIVAVGGSAHGHLLLTGYSLAMAELCDELDSNGGDLGAAMDALKARFHAVENEFGLDAGRDLNS